MSKRSTKTEKLIEDLKTGNISWKDAEDAIKKIRQRVFFSRIAEGMEGFALIVIAVWTAQGPRDPGILTWILAGAALVLVLHALLFRMPD